MSEQALEASLEGELVLGRFLAVTRHAQGGMAWIYKGIDQQDQSPIALKIMFSKWRQDPKVCERFAQEVRVHTQLRHPNIIDIKAHIDDGRLMGMAMEWVDEGDLKLFLEKHDGPMSMELIEELFFPLLDAMIYAHKQNIVHRDIKPGNVLLTRVGGRLVPKLTDFGIAKVVTEPGVTFTGAKLGTPHYMAPEQWRDSKNVDHRADIYSLGVILYRMVTGHLPFDGTYQQLIVKLLDEPAPYPKGVDAALAGVILRCLEKEPAERFGSCELFSNTLRRAFAMAKGSSSKGQKRSGASTLPRVGDHGHTAVAVPALLEKEPLFADDPVPKKEHRAAPRSSGLSDFNKTAAWGDEEIVAALNAATDEEIEKSLEKAAFAQNVAAEASLQTVAFDLDDPDYQKLQASFDEPIAQTGPLPMWILVLLGALMLGAGGLIGWFFSRG